METDAPLAVEIDYTHKMWKLIPILRHAVPPITSCLARPSVPLTYVCA
jgi:hypothetical protein